MRENTGICKYGFCGFLLRKNGCSGSLRSCCSFFAVAVCADPPPDPLIALTVTVRSQLNIAYRSGMVIR